MERIRQWSGAIVWGAILLPTTILIVLVADCYLRAGHHDRDAAAWIEILELSSPSFWPAGTPQRHPQFLPPALDLRMSPLFDWDRDGRLRPSSRR